MTKTSKAELKRQFASHDSVLFVANWCPEPTERKIVARQSNGVALSHPTKPDSESWLYFDQKGDIIEIDDDGYYVVNGQLKYKFLEVA